MRILLLLASFVWLLTSCVGESTEYYSLMPGDSLPEFEVKDNNGFVVSPPVLKGKICVFAFVNTGCPDCRKELPELQIAYESLQNNQSVYFVAIGRNETSDSLADYWRENKLTMPYSGQSTDDVYKLFASEGIPRIFIADETGVIVYVGGPEPAPAGKDICEFIQRLIGSNGGS